MIWNPRWWCVMLIVSLCIGCVGQGAPIAYYTMQPGTDFVGHSVDGRSPNLIIGLGPVTLPKYLDRDALVTRVSPNRLSVNEGHRWAGSLPSEILHVLAENIEGSGQAKEVVLYPWPTRIEPDLRFLLEIQSFEGKLGGSVVLRAVWSMAPSSSDQPALRRVTSIEEQTGGDGVEAMVAAMGRALAQLSREMSASISKANP